MSITKQIPPTHPIFVSAEDEEIATSGTCGENLTWNFEESTGTLTISGTGVMENYSYLEPSWCNLNQVIKKIIIEDGVTTIGDNAFQGCTALESIVIPDGVITIGNGAFFDCESLVSVKISNCVTTIGDDAFLCCKSLMSVTIPDSVTTIGAYAFFECMLESIEISDNVTTIGENAFTCQMNISENNPNYSSQDGILFNKEKSELIYFPNFDNITEYTIPQGVTSIARQAFEECYSLKAIIIPDSVTTIGEYAFFECTALESIVIPNSVTTIERLAFYNCESLTSVTIPDSVIKIGNGAFYDCEALTSIIIENSECEIDDSEYTISDTATIYGYDNSTAQAYAKNYDRKFVSLLLIFSAEYGAGNVSNFEEFMEKYQNFATS
ncbi:MAG: leucine-rich repeat domain-containing protein [Oscillospiraceae bacterium]|nr:leucine-rich repeat domain-containing protein [Oscillospiraceae bacterium]